MSAATTHRKLRMIKDLITHKAVALSMCTISEQKQDTNHTNKDKYNRTSQKSPNKTSNTAFSILSFN